MFSCYRTNYTNHQNLFCPSNLSQKCRTRSRQSHLHSFNKHQQTKIYEWVTLYNPNNQAPRVNIFINPAGFLPCLDLNNLQCTAYCSVVNANSEQAARPLLQTTRYTSNAKTINLLHPRTTQRALITAHEILKMQSIRISLHNILISYVAWGLLCRWSLWDMGGPWWNFLRGPYGHIQLWIINILQTTLFFEELDFLFPQLGISLICHCPCKMAAVEQTLQFPIIVH